MWLLRHTANGGWNVSQICHNIHQMKNDKSLIFMIKYVSWKPWYIYLKPVGKIKQLRLYKAVVWSCHTSRFCPCHYFIKRYLIYKLRRLISSSERLTEEEEVKKKMKYWIKNDSFHGPGWYRLDISDLVLSSAFQLYCSN